MASYSVRDAIKLAIKWHRVAIDTSNRELRVNTREFIRNHWSMRNSENVLILNK